MSPDLKIATVFVLPLGGGAGAETIVKALARSAKFFRRELAREISQMKFMPELRFRLDTRFDDDDRMREVLAAPTIVADLSDAARAGDDAGLGTDSPEAGDIGADHVGGSPEVVTDVGRTPSERAADGRHPERAEGRSDGHADSQREPDSENTHGVAAGGRNRITQPDRSGSAQRGDHGGTDTHG